MTASIRTNTPELPQRRIAWKKVIFFAYLHAGALYGIYVFPKSLYPTWIWFVYLCLISTQGTAVGAHRLWCHRTFKAKLPLRLLLAFYQTLTFQKDIYDWCRDHRLHHKYSDTEFDPHNAQKGFFYSHMGWLMLKKEESIITKGKELDLKDLEDDPVVMFQRKYYWYMAPFVAFIFPAVVPWYFWNENFQISWYICSILRFLSSLHVTCLVNSAAHIFGNRPYNKKILPTENMFVSLASNGEGFHNYHHTFPWDYKAAELGTYFLNGSTAFIDFMAMIGWAYDLKSVPPRLVEERANKTGDGTRRRTFWGWGDREMGEDDIKTAQISYQRVARG